MNVEKGIIELEERIFSDLKEAATNAQTERTLLLSKNLERIKNLKNSYKFIISEMDSIQKSIDGKITDDHTETNFEDNAIIDGPTSRDRAQIARKSFIDQLKLKGVILYNFKGKTLYQNINDEIIGIAYSSKIKNKWFLGLPVGDYKAIVLMCEDNNQNPIRFILDKNKFKSIKQFLSTDGDNTQFKFNVHDKNGVIILKLKNDKTLNLDPLRDNFGAFQ